MKSIRQRSQKRKSHVDSDKMAVMNAWHRIDCRTREALRRSFLSELIEGYEVLLLTNYFIIIQSELCAYVLPNSFKR